MVLCGGVGAENIVAVAGVCVYAYAIALCGDAGLCGYTEVNLLVVKAAADFG